MRYGPLLGRLTRLGMLHPSLILPMLRTGWRFRARRWYSVFPFVPLPPREYVAWRLYTAYGSEDALPPYAELERYLRWVSRSHTS